MLPKLPDLFATIRYQGRNCRMRGLTPGDHIFQCWQETGQFYELPLLETIQKARLEGVYVDVGSHLGNHSIFFARHCYATRVIAIEARPEAADVLEDNLERNSPGPYTVKRCAATAKKGWANLSKMNPMNVGSGKAEYSEEEGQVIARPLDTIIQSKERIAVIKIDIEGGELDALKGARRILHRDKPLIAVEASTLERQKGVFEFLSGLGYTQKHQFTQGMPTFIWTAK